MPKTDAVRPHISSEISPAAPDSGSGLPSKAWRCRGSVARWLAVSSGNDILTLDETAGVLPGRDMPEDNVAW